MVISVITYILIEFIFEDILKDFSIKIIINFFIKENIIKTVFIIINN